ncbi:peptide chain release factor 2 [Aphanomyces astaci]|uniref:Peptide chain release factor 2 n=1 Tax=Aphanomyces astaci TaxID=112090 RepID=W4FL59_APHAT|nr:peptide chain release factor 2 [Aphanomyces astaci]ETV67601.1 peptide chain release factor 2 [Aphanomyces astaci]|eukprot:XP_009842858.1 peptide chain release factor 2 [Aphanomyces astaci]
MGPFQHRQASRALWRRIEPWTRCQVRQLATESTRSTKALVSDFMDKYQSASSTVSLIHQVLATPQHAADLLRLRHATSHASLWDDPVQAASLLQQLSVLEKRDTVATQLTQTLDDTKELFDMAMDENDVSVLDDCVATVDDAEVTAKNLRAALLLSEPTDPSSCFVEIHAGAGGTESGDWVEMLLRMYTRWAEAHPDGYRAEVVHAVLGEEAGYRSVCVRIDGSYAYGWLKTEGGVHRLVRISPFDSQSRRHTSFAQVRVFPLAARGDTKVVAPEISTKHLRIDTFRASGPGGQHVNKTESAIRITHLPTNIVVQCQSDRSQHRNKDTAMDMLRARLLQLALLEQDVEKKKYTQGLGDNAWGSQIRSYVLHPYKMVKDHRTNMTCANAKGVLDGDISPFIQQVLVASASIKPPT